MPTYLTVSKLWSFLSQNLRQDTLHCKGRSTDIILSNGRPPPNDFFLYYSSRILLLNTLVRFDVLFVSVHSCSIQSYILSTLHSSIMFSFHTCHQTRLPCSEFLRYPRLPSSATIFSVQIVIVLHSAVALSLTFFS